jgi:hypothetical protein
MLARLRPCLTYANVVSTLCLFVLLGGSGYAAVKISGKNIKNRSIAGKKLKRNTLGGKEIKESKLAKVRRAARADSATTADSAKIANSATAATSAERADNASMLGGLGASAFTRRACTSESGAVKGVATINASAGFSSTFTTAGVTSAYNCGGGTVEARRNSAGLYEVRFSGSGDHPAVAGVQVSGLGPTSWPGDLNVSVGKVNASSPYRVSVLFGGSGVDFPFVIVLV